MTTMGSSLTLFLPLKVKDLEKVVGAFQEEFDSILDETFSTEELALFERQIDAIAAVYVQPVLPDLSFDDFYADPDVEEVQKHFFKNAQSTILIENLPFLENNPFQVSYLLELLKKFSEVLIDRGGISELLFKEKFLQALKGLKTIDYYTASKEEKKVLPVVAKAVDPIDFLIADVYKEVDRVKENEIDFKDFNPKLVKLYDAMKSEKLDSVTLFRRSQLNAKDFDDGLEKLKFFLRKI